MRVMRDLLRMAMLVGSMMVVEGYRFQGSRVVMKFGLEKIANVGKVKIPFKVGPTESCMRG